MNPRVSAALIFVLVLATFITGAVAYPYVGDARLAFGLPVVLLALWGLWALLPAIDPVAKGFPGFRHFYDLFWILLTAVLTYGYALKLGQALGWHVDVLQATMPAGGVDHGAPGIRESYGPTYYAAFVLDPDGNNIEVVCR